MVADSHDGRARFDVRREEKYSEQIEYIMVERIVRGVVSGEARQRVRSLKSSVFPSEWYVRCAHV